MSNCRIGDLAWVIKSEFPENIRGIVSVRAAGIRAGEWTVETLTHFRGFDGLTLSTVRLAPGTLCQVEDDALQPIRDQPGADEMLRIAGHPLSQSHREKTPEVAQ